jgi:hypothetical protein
MLIKCFKPNGKIQVLHKLRHNLLVINHKYKLGNTSLKSFLRQKQDFSENKIVVSSAYKINLHKLDIEGKSLIYKRNNKGPSTEPWGTPRDTRAKSDLLPSISTY